MGISTDILPINKVFDDVCEYVKARDFGFTSEPVTAESVYTQEDDVVLFANDLSKKYGVLISVELIEQFIKTYYDSIDKDRNG